MSENRPRGILLVEEYGALGIAISSALRKFAPLHRVEIAHSFAEAEVAAAKIRPELFVLDLDPPPSGEIEFLSRLKALYPEARSLVIAAGTSRELRAERGTAGAIQFVEKPFDLAEFGAAVQALVGPWTGPPGTVRGTLRDLGIIDIVQLKCLANSNTAVRIEIPDDHQGEIHFQKGQITHAESGSLAGVAALEQILAWSGGQMSEQDLPAAAPRTIDRARDELLLPALRKIAAQKREASAPLPVPPQQPEKSGPRILVIDDTEMLLIFVADVLATADQTFQITTASSGEAGVKLAIETRPDLVLLDYSLADMTGDKVCHALLDDERTARTPVLMMSGHPTELARTAAGYKNVVSTLPKPFLSGALINAVEKTLAAGPLPKAIASPKPATAPAPAPPTVKDERKPLSSNGHAPGSDGPSAKTSIVTETVVEEVAPLTSRAILQRPKPTAVPATGPPPSGATADVAPVARATALRLTFSLEVVALRLTSSLQMDIVRLKPTDLIVAAEMESAAGAKNVIETGFRLARIELNKDGGIETVRLTPTRQGFEMPAAANSFAIGDINLRRGNSHLDLEFVAAPNQSMGVQLSAQFELSQIELSPAFEVAALLVRARSRRVFVRNSREAGTAFELDEVELDSTGELRQLLVRPTA